MKLAVMGANGTLGRALVEGAVRRGHDVVAATRGAPKRTFLRAVNRSADIVTGEGVADALASADAVINAANAQRGFRQLLVDGTKRLIDMAAEAGVRHYVGISLVGIDHVTHPYNVAKLAQERVVEEASIGWSLLRTTQFHDFIDAMFARSARFGFVFAPIGTRLQPVDVAEVAGALLDAAEAGPSRRLPDLGGPEQLSVRELAQQWLTATKRTRVIIPGPIVGRLGQTVRAGALCVPDQGTRALGKKTFAAFVAERYGH